MDESVERAQFGAWVRRTRKAQGLSQEALAHMTGLAVNTISRVESTSREDHARHDLGAQVSAW